MKDNRGKTRKAFKAYCLLLAFLLALPGMGSGEDMGDLIAAEAGASVVITDSTGETSLKVDPAPAGELPDPSSDNGEKSEPAGNTLSEEAEEVPDSSPETGADLEPAGKMVPEKAEEASAEQLPAPSTEAKKQEPAGKMIPEETEEASAEQLPDTSPDTGEDLEPAGTMLPEDADEIPAEELPDPSSDPGENPEPAEEIPSGEMDDSPAEQLPDSSSETGKDPEPTEEIPSGEKDDSPAEQLPGSSSDTGTAPESTGKKVSGESEKAQEEAASREGILYVDAVCEIQLQGSRTYLLTIPRKSDLVLTVSGIPVKVTVALPQNGQMRYWESAAAEEQGVFGIHEPLSLEKGEYSITIEPLQENQQGSVSICFSTPEPEVPVLTDAAAEDLPAAGTAITEEIQIDTILEEEAFEPESGSVITETAEETVPAAEADEPDEPAEETGEVPENFIPEEEAEDGPEADPLQDPAENASDDESVPVEGTDPDTDPDAVPVEPDGADSDETAAEPLTVRIVASCEEDFQPGTRVVLTAVVSVPDYEGTIRWQYSADGGMTVCDVDDADGEEYSFILDEENITYLWRAYLE